MEGELDVATTRSVDRAWHRGFVKLDDVTGQLICFRDATQSETKWSLPLQGADVSTPIPGTTSYGIDADAVAYCIVVHGASFIVYLDVRDAAGKKAWSSALLRTAQEGPLPVVFTKVDSSDDFTFLARVAEVRVDGNKAEYKLLCSCRFFNVAYARKMSIEWAVWHRFSHFAALDSALRASLGPRMHTIAFLPCKREALRTLLRHQLDSDFLAQRRLGLDAYITKDTLLTQKEARKHTRSNAKPKPKPTAQQLAETPQDELPSKAPQAPKALKEAKKKSRAKEEDTRTADAIDRGVTPSVSATPAKAPPPPVLLTATNSDAVSEAPPPTTARANLLAQIQQGAQLKKASVP
ncbi:hypothetical protein ACHHYP_02369 [Achlya hypogyna]|uniref:PX domain-containing protein n=1 Tax=Achlya hypogyna TaxID=1202772 RepID=A0A1V9Z6Q4_ACHHY|nr:hypothetical protein ACHHYP_02369 [Achlya hypogyna]